MYLRGNARSWENGKGQKRKSAKNCIRCGSCGFPGAFNSGEKWLQMNGILCSHLYNFYAQRVDGDDKDTVQLEKHEAVTKSEMYRILQGFLSGQAAKRNLRSGGKWQTFTAKNSNRLNNPCLRGVTRCRFKLQLANSLLRIV